MKIKPSPLELKDFVVINFDYTFIPFTGDKPLQDIFKEYDVDVDFAIRPDDPDLSRIFVKAKINRPPDGESQPGYSIAVECLGLFTLKAKIDKAEYSEHFINSGLTMTLSYMRSFVAGVTGHFPVGRFWIPSMDLNDLVRQKQLIMRKKNKEKKKDAKNNQAE